MSHLAGHNAENRRDPLTELIPSAAVFMLHSEIACSPTAWVDQIGGRSIAGVGTPVVAADGAFFNGRVVAQSAITGSKSWLGTGLGTIVAAGTRPWIYCVARARATDAVTRFFVGTNGLNGLRARTTSFRCLWDSTGSLDSPGASDANVHQLSTWVTASATNLRLDQTTTSTGGYTAALVANITAVGIGQDTLGANIMDASVAFVLICSSLPSTAEFLALDTWAKSYWGVP